MHKEGAIYPKRYFDDLVMEKQLAAQQSLLENSILRSSIGDASRIKDLVTPKLPFGLPSGKMSQSTGQQYIGKNQHAALYGTTASFFNAKISSPRIS